MNKWIVLGLAATFGAANMVMRTVQGTPVELQPSSPGVEQTGHLNISGTATVGLLKSQGTVFGQATSPTGISYGGFFTAASNQARGFYGYASSPSGLTYGGFFQNASTTGRAVYGLATATSGNSYGGYFQTASTAGRGILGVAASATGTTYGVYGKAVSPNGYGLYSEGNMGVTGVLSGYLANFQGSSGNQIIAVNNVATSPDASAIKAIATGASGVTNGGYFASLSPTGRGVYAFSQGTGVLGEGTIGLHGVGGERGVYGRATGSGFTYGVYGQSESTSGFGVLGHAPASSGPTFGGYFRSDSPNGTGVSGWANTTSGLALGVKGLTNSTQGTGVWGETTATSGSNQGVYGLNRSLDGFGVYGHNTVGTGVLGTTNGTNPNYSIGVKGVGNGVASDGVVGRATALHGDGVVGIAVDEGSGIAVYALGDSLTTGAKMFRIDHPFDPENKYLMHYSTESPTPQNFYVGNVVTDASGYAWVELPDYFAEINTNFKYQLTIVDDADATGFVQVKVSKKIQGKRFQIRTSVPKTEVSWRVDADRNDLYLRKFPAKDVQEKEVWEKGTYQHPGLYNLGPERGLYYDPALDMAKSKSPPAQEPSRSKSKR